MTEYTIININNDIKLAQPHGGLAYGTDALLLAAFTRRQKNASAVELGSGTGVISMLMLKRDKIASSRCIEIQSDYHEIACINAELNGLSGRMEPICADASKYTTDERFDVLFTNPPYMVTSGKPSPDIKRLTARHEVSGGINEFCKAAARLLRYGGQFYAVYRPERLCDLLCAMRDNRIEPKRLTTVYEDREHQPCLTLIEGRLGGQPGLFCTPPFFIRESVGGDYSAEYKFQYENGDFDERYYLR